MPKSASRSWRIVSTLAPVLLALAAAVACATPPTSISAPTSTPEPADPTPTRVPTSTPEPLVPTRTPPGALTDATETATPTVALTATPEGATALEPPPPTAAAPVPRGRGRFGVGVALGPITEFAAEELGIGWYLDWAVRERPPRPGGAEFWQMVRVSEDGYRPPAQAIRAAAAANPGSFWIIGNEPDVRWQDDTTPERYAQLYHELYTLLKEVDPTCHVVIGGVSQPTPLRLAYLERILESYQERYGEPMPVDVWNVHGFILREERGSWGVDIPPGIDVDVGTLYEIEDHDDLSIFSRQIRDFRRWMADQGQREKPLVVSEYGILMPEDYGFGPAAVRGFLEGSFDFFLTATDDEVGYPQDGNRLVQWWCWYSLSAPDDYYPTGNLFDPLTKEMTALGAAFAGYSVP